ncbi:MAG: PilZ domain-containing protein, partial [Candidatus Thiodiazotropha sp.]
MEHRYYPRLDAALKVGVFKGDELLGYFTTRNISLDGLFIETQGLALSINDVIGILIGINGDAHMQKGIVVHRATQGIGVMLIDLDKQVFQGIFNFFRHQQLPIGRVLDGIDRRMPAEIQKALPA